MVDKQKEQNKQETQHSVFVKTLGIGFTAGVLWSSLAALTYYFHFSEVSAASFLFRSYWQTNWTGTWLAEVLAVLIVGVLSILIAMLYYVLLKGKNGLWPGALFGVALWALVFFVLTPLFPAIPAFSQMTSDTWVTTLCQFILYGIFIGYSISYEYREFNQPANSYSNQGSI